MDNFNVWLVFPVPQSEQEQLESGMLAGPEMPGDVKPVREGSYLRYFDDCEDWAWSEWDGKEWLRDGFFASDVQDAPWKGGVYPGTFPAPKVTP